jgi:hypothetical protein
MSLSVYPPGVSGYDIEQLFQDNFPDTCRSCGGEIEDPSYNLADGPSMDFGNEIYHARCFAEIWAESLDLEARDE